MPIAPIVTRGYGSFGSIALVVTRGFLADDGELPAIIPVTYPLDLPSAPVPAQTSFRLRPFVAAAASPFTGESQAVDWGGTVWMFSASYPPMSRAKANYFIAFFAKLRGRKGWFWAPDWDRRTPKGVITGSPLVDGGGQTGNVLTLKSLPASTAGLLLPGDLIQVGNHLHMIIEPVSSNGAGKANAQIEPALRTSPADGAAVIYLNARGMFRMDSNDLPWDSDAAAAHGIRFSATEKL